MANYRGRAPISKKDLRIAKQQAKKTRQEKMNSGNGTKRAAGAGFSRKALIIIVSSVVGVAVIGMLVFIITQRRPSEDELISYIENGVFVNKTVIEEIDVSGQTISEARISLADSVQNELMNANVTFTVEGKEYTEDAMSLGLITDIEDVLIDAMLFEKSGSVFDRSANARLAEKDGVFYDIKVVALEENVSAAVSKILPKFRIEVQEPTMVFDPEAETEDAFITWTDEVAGVEVVEEAFINSVIEQVNLGNYGLGAVATKILQPEKTKAEVASSIIKLSEFTSDYSHGELDEKNRKFNISYMAEKLSGSIINVGDVWSINDTAGERTEENGWKKAHAIRGAVMIDELGGGVCQVSGTIYNAFLLADVGIVERHGHTYPSPYLPIGLDATIDFPRKDLKIQNTLSDTIYLVVAADYDAENITAMVYGPPSDHGYQVIIRAIEQDKYSERYKATDPEFRVAPGGLAPNGEYVWNGQQIGHPPKSDGSVWYTYRYYYPADYDIEEDPAYSWIGYDGADKFSGEKLRLPYVGKSDKFLDTVYPAINGVYYLNPDDPRTEGLEGSTYDPNAGGADSGDGSGDAGGGDGGDGA